MSVITDDEVQRTRFCCLHIVVEDHNLTDDSVDFCIREAGWETKPDCICLPLAQRIAIMSFRERMEFLRPTICGAATGIDCWAELEREADCWDEAKKLEP